MRALCLLLVALFIGGPRLEAGGAPAPALLQPAEGSTRCGCLIVGLQGKTHVRLENTFKEIAATLNMPVFSGDELTVSQSSRIMLVCGEANKQHPMSAGFHPVPCTPGDRGPLWINGQVVDPGGMRGDSIFPRLLSPRKTLLLDPHPRIRWASVAGVPSYTVRVRGSNLDWHTSVQSNEVTYPNDAPPLLAGQSYSISIFAGRQKSDDEGVSGLEFRILEAAEAATVKARSNEIMNLNVDKTAKRLLIAYLYASHGLNAEALMQLDETSNDPETVRMLAELYLETRLLDSAEKQYLRAIDLAGEDIIWKAWANQRLGQIYQALRKNEKASQRYEDALTLFRDLKNWVTVEKLARSLADLQKR